MVKKVIKFVSSFLAGIFIGVAIVFLIATFVTGDSPSSLADVVARVDVMDIVASCAMSLAAFLITTMLQIIIHEGGHLACGLLSGYRFVSFRIGGLALIRHNGRFALRRFSVSGTGGQCLMLPPDGPPDDVPATLYNAGGIIANAVTAAASVAALVVCDHIAPFAVHLLVFNAIIGFFFAALNGIPMNMNGITNDGYNIMLFRRNRLSHRLFVNQLRINAMIQDGLRPKDIPEELFHTPTPADYSDTAQASAVITAASRKLDTGHTAEAHAMLCEAEEHKDKMIGLLVKEAECELLFTSLVLGKTDMARQLYTEELKEYITTYRKTMSSKQRILCAVAMLMDNDPEEARRIYATLKDNAHKYMMQGEAMMDIELARSVVGQ